MIAAANTPVRATINTEVDQSLFMMMIESLPHAVLLIDASGLIAYSNVQARTLFGDLREQTLIFGAGESGYSLVSLLGIPFRTVDLPWFSTLRSGQTERRVRMGVRESKGDTLWIDVDTTVVARSDTGSVESVLVAAVDVTAIVAEETASSKAGLRTISILESIGDAFYALDRDWRFTYVNPQAETWLRHTSEELIGQRAWDVFPDIVDSPLYNTFLRVAETRNPESLELHYAPFGAWYEARLFPAADGMSVYFRDISERYRVETALMVSEAQYRTVVEQVPAVIYTETADIARTFAYLSPYVKELLGWPPEDFLATRGLWTSRIHPDDLARVHAIGDASKENGTRYTAEYRLIASDGRIVWVEDTAELILDPKGRPLWWQGVALDITARVQAQERIAASEEHFRTLVQHAADLVSVISAEGKIVYQSPALERVLGYKPDDRAGENGLAFIHPADLPLAQKVLSEVAAGPTGSLATLELRARHHDGSWRYLEATATNLLDEPSIRGLVINSRDITERKLLEDDLRHREARHQALLTAFPDPIVRLDRAGRYLDIEAKHSTLLITPGEVLLGKTVFDILPSAVAGAIVSAIALALDLGVMQTIEYQIERTEGVRDFEVRIVAAGTNEVVALVRDVTQQREAAERVLKSEERLRLALASAGMGAWDLHLPTDTVVWSPTLCSLLGLPAATITTTTEEYRSRFVHPDDLARATTAKMTANTGEDFDELEYRVIRTDGEIRWLIDVGSVVERDPDGQATRSAGVTIDVTALRLSQAAFRLRDRALSAALDGIAITDMTIPDQPIIDANAAFFEITGYGADEVLGGNSSFLWGPETDPDELRTIRHALSEGRAVTSTILNYRKDGTSFWNELHLSPVRDTDNKLTHFVGVVHDVTERRAADRELIFQAELLDQATVAVIAASTTGAVTHWNRHAEVLYGWTRLEAVGRNLKDLNIGPSEIATAEMIADRLHNGMSWEGDFLTHRKDGAVIPVHVVDSPVRDVSGVTTGIVRVSVDISERKAFEGRLAYQATHDPLTGLPNRTLFTDRLEHSLADAASRSRALTVMFIDLDGFKRINDSFGHSTGDELLMSVSRRLAGELGPTATLGRFGGDEFTMLLPEISTSDAACDAAEQILARLHEPFLVDGREMYADASIGVAQSSSTLSRPEDVLRAADVALYQAKSAGRATYRLFDPGTSSDMPARLELESDLRRAVERAELRLFFQPEVDLRTGAIVGAEALVRWQHPRRGLLPPGEFIELAEESNLIVEIGSWVLAEACQQARTWRMLGLTEQRLTVSVNLTARQLRQPDLIDQIRKITDETELPPNLLKLEITERTVVEDVEGEANVLTRLRALGVKLAIDDFGTGYSSLGYLRRWPTDTLKIDRSFVDGVDVDSGAQSLVAAMAGLAYAVGADVTAEGIETAGQLEWLRSMGVQRGQGYYFARPMPAEAFADLLRRGERYGTADMTGKDQEVVQIMGEKNLPGLIKLLA